METIKVNMTPCEDIKTIHASQDDNEAREWGFELHNNGDAIDSSEITDQMVFKAYEGGTEEILPTNGSVPTTAPFKGDIKYPQGLLTDQEFTYRQSPTESDGLAFVESIKGNTVVWNQLIPVDAQTSGSSNGITFTNNNDGSWTVSGTATATAQRRVSQYLSVTNGHKYLIKGCMSTGGNNYQLRVFKNNGETLIGADTGNGYMLTADSTYTNISLYFIVINGATLNGTIYPQVFDLTQMGLDITSADEFDSLFPKPYYDYCQGAMLSFGGRNVKFNQLVQNGNFADTSSWDKYNCTLSVSNNVATITATATSGNIYTPTSLRFAPSNGDKILVCGKFRAGTGTARLRFNVGGTINVTENATTTWQTVANIVTAGSSGTGYVEMFAFDNSTAEYKDAMVFNLTQMFGAGNEPSAEGFLELFPNGYYEYTTGKYMNLGQPVSLKTVGKNLFDFSQFANGTITFENGVLTGTAAQFYMAYRDVVNTGIELKYPKNTQITISFDARTEQNVSSSGGGVYLVASENGSSVQLAMTMNETTAIQHITVTIPSNRHIDKLGWTYGSNGFNIWHITNFQVEFGATETPYEPYTTSTLSLPISAYFSNGMKSAGNVYDELTETKAITRIGAVDLGTLTWNYNSANAYFTTNEISSLYKVPSSNLTVANIIDPKHTSISANDLVSGGQLGIAIRSNGTLMVKDTNYTDANAFKTAMNGVYLYYELATPTETTFTTASLVTENAEIPLSNDDGTLIGKCTEQLSENPGFFDAKIKLADGDGECYSNKIQLHVERKPS